MEELSMWSLAKPASKASPIRPSLIEGCERVYRGLTRRGYVVYIIDEEYKEIEAYWEKDIDNVKNETENEDEEEDEDEDEKNEDPDPRYERLAKMLKPIGRLETEDGELWQYQSEVNRCGIGTGLICVAVAAIPCFKVRTDIIDSSDERHLTAEGRFHVRYCAEKRILTADNFPSDNDEDDYDPQEDPSSPHP